MRSMMRSGLLTMLGVLSMMSVGWALTDEEIFSQFQLNLMTPGARATAFGGAFIGLADDATAVESNPAGLTKLGAPEVFIEFKRLTYSITQVYDNIKNEAGKYDFTRLDKHEYDKTVTGVPFASVVYPYSGEKRRFVFSAYRQELVNYASSFKTADIIIITQTDTMFTFPTQAAMEVNVTNYGVGAAVDFFDGQMSLAVSPRWSTMQMTSHTSNYSVSAETLRTTFTDAEIYAKTKIDDDDIGFSVNAGLKWDPDPRISFGAVYRSGPKFNVKYAAYQWNEAKELAVLSLSPDQKDFTLKIPDSFGAGVAFRALDVEKHALQFMTDVVYIQYKDLLEDFDTVWKSVDPKHFEINDVTEMHVGLEYEPKFLEGERLQALFLRAGIYSEPDHNIRYTGENLKYQQWFPGGDEDQIHLTGGVGVKLGVKGQSVDLDTAVNIADNNKQFSVSMVYYF